MSEVPLHGGGCWCKTLCVTFGEALRGQARRRQLSASVETHVQGSLAIKSARTPPPLGPPQGPRGIG